MSQTSTTGYWEIDQTDLFDKLDIAFTITLVLAGMITFPPACFVYYRILTLRNFQSQYLMKLFVLNGFSNMLIYLVNLIAVQFSNWPSAFDFYSWLNRTYLKIIFRFLQDYSLSVMWQTTLFISINRLMSLRHQFHLSKYDRKYFLAGSLCSLILSAVICFPLFFSNYTYYQFPITDEVFAYIPYIPDSYKWSSQLPQAFHLSLAAATLIVDGIISITIVQMRKEYSAKMRSRPEQGLLLSSFIALLMHVMNDLLLMSTSIFDNITLTYFITLTITVSTTLPFWTMLAFAHTMRRTVFFGTWFVGAASTTVGVNSVRTTASAQF